MAITYNGFFRKLKERGISQQKLRTDKMISQLVLQKLRSGGGIDTRTINRLCKLLDCQPGDIMEYAPDE